MPVSRVVRTLLVFVGKPLFLFLTGLLIISAVILGGLVQFAKTALWLAQVALYLLGKAVLLAINGIILWIRLAGTVRLPRFKPAVPRFLVNKKVLVVGVMALTVWFIMLWARFLIELPQPGQLLTRDQIVSTKIYDRNGKLLFKIFRNQNRTLVPLSKIPPHVRLATIAIEDAEFYDHHGFSIRGIARAIRRNIARDGLSGGSTITQQLVKNAFLSPEKTVSRKLKEIILAIRVEIEFPKDQILEMYLNEVSYGGSSYGIEEAAQLYFGRSAQELSLAQGALLAGLPRAPTAYSPFGANPYLAKARQLEVLSRMAQEGYITAAEAEKGSQEKLVFAPQRTDIAAPHFVMYVKQLLVQEYGERMVEEGGLNVVTSLDLDIQKMTQEMVLEEVKNIAKLNISNGAALVTVPETGEILAMAGSIDYFNQTIDGNFNVTTAARQPGSSIKPINYAYALGNRRYTPASIISDTPITYHTAAGPSYSPRNYDNRFRGPVTLRTALASSLNVPAVQVLASYGVDKMIEQARKMGITSWTDPSRFGLSLTLGGGEVKMIDMAVVYGSLANYGKRVDLKPILKVTDYRGRVLKEAKCEGSETLSDCSKQVLDPSVAFILTDILRDNGARTPAFGPNSLLVVPNHPEVAVKTGTTQNLRDNWAIGYTKDYVVATWVGNNNNRPMAYVASGVTGATPIWHKIITNLLANKPSYEWPIPENVVAISLCGSNGKKEYFLDGTQPAFACIPRPQAEKKDELPEEQERRGEIL